MHQLSQIAKVKLVAFTGLQSVVDQGDAGMIELYEQTKSMFGPNQYKSEVFEKQIAFNCLPKVGDLRSCGFTIEEITISTKKLKKFCKMIL